MNNAAKNHIGEDFLTRQPTAKTAAPTVRRIRQLDSTPQGRGRNPERPTKIRTHGDAAHGFLKTSFLPKLKGLPSEEDWRETRQIESDFYTSLAELGVHYGIEPLATIDFAYPYNIALSLWDTQRKLKQKCRNWHTLRLVQETDKTFLVSEERYITGDTLYYIPVVPLFQLLKDPLHKRKGQLLLSVCAYLYQVADVPYYRQENSYLYWMYEMLHDWVEQEEETEDTALFKREWQQAEWIGDYMEQKIFNHSNLVVFEQRLNSFRCRNESDNAYYQLAKDAFLLYREYPNETLFRNASRREAHDDDENETITMDKYISFFADCTGCLYESLSDSINNELSEYGAIEEPMIEKCFDGNGTTEHDLDFESRVFTLIEHLCYLLNHYKRAER
ncbi:hypothetical protein [Emticicia sp. TH156]|uniref:hypothetical protein n=1 Tax=Emticicia sp. TH156 TaxID=2067454 RepID=UPI000C76434C|nr:hypothetical protein [Emticicia sp. TH156]PLK44871.1 hypothetical protein C0V77_06365 [Emticicia sp. TH156]